MEPNKEYFDRVLGDLYRKRNQLVEQAELKEKGSLPEEYIKVPLMIVNILLAITAEYGKDGEMTTEKKECIMKYVEDLKKYEQKDIIDHG